MADRLDFDKTMSGGRDTFRNSSGRPVVGLMILNMVKKSGGSRLFWRLMYFWTAVNVVLWSLVLC